MTRRGRLLRVAALIVAVALAAGGLSWGLAVLSASMRRGRTAAPPRPGQIARIYLSRIPETMAVGEGAAWVEVGTAQGAQNLFRVDASTNAAALVPGVRGALWPAAGAGAVWVGVCPTGDRCRDGLVLRIDPRTLRVVARIPVESPGPIAVGEVGVWVGTDSVEGELLKIDPTTNRIVDRFGCCRGLIEVGEGAVWVAGAREVIRIDPASGKVLARIRAPLRDACEMTVGEGAVWVASCLTGLPPRTGPDELWRIDPTTNEVVATLSLPPHAAVMLTRGGGYVWLAATSRDRPGVRIMRVDPRTNRFAGPSIDISPAHPKYLYAGLGVAGSFIQVSDHSVWVTLFSDGAVVRVGV